MKIFIASDLHGEMGSHGYNVPEGLDFDVAVFAGDLHHAYRAVNWLNQPARAVGQGGAVRRRQP
ncbi:Icc-related predicted phosphoesterase [Bradyrhizobium sp. GM6.1]